MNAVRLAALAVLVLAVPAVRAADKSPAKAPRNVELTLTDNGLAPAEVRVARGEPVHLGITRKTNRTCMTEVVIADVGVKQALPLNKTVWVDFTASKAGSFRILCGMGMDYGKLVVN